MNNNMDVNDFYDYWKLLGLSIHTINCLKNAEIKNIFELQKKTYNELLKIKGFGRVSLEECKRAIEKRYLTSLLCPHCRNTILLTVSIDEMNGVKNE